jgi:hypothetical protein
LHIAGPLEAAVGFVAGVGEGSWNVLSIGGHRADLPYLTYIFALYYYQDLSIFFAEHFHFTSFSHPI